MADAECLRKLYVKIKYIQPFRLRPPQDYALVFFSEPEIVFDEDPPFGIDLVCEEISTEGVGAVILFFQVSAYIQWQVSFKDTQGKLVRETHKILVSLPISYSLSFPEIMLSRLFPWKFRLARYAAKLAALYKKLNEIERVLEKIFQLKQSISPENIKDVRDGLENLEKELNDAVRLWASSGGSGQTALLMKFGRPGTGCSPGTGTRIA